MRFSVEVVETVIGSPPEVEIIAVEVVDVKFDIYRSDLQSPARVFGYLYFILQNTTRRLTNQ